MCSHRTLFYRQTTRRRADDTTRSAAISPDQPPLKKSLCTRNTLKASHGGAPRALSSVISPIHQRNYSHLSETKKIPFQWLPGFIPARVKRPESEADNSPPFSDQINWSYTSTPSRTFTACKGAALFVR